MTPELDDSGAIDWHTVGPDLLAALEAMVESAAGDDWGAHGTRTALGVTLFQARAAIERATGSPRAPFKGGRQG